MVNKHRGRWSMPTVISEMQTKPTVGQHLLEWLNRETDSPHVLTRMRVTGILTHCWRIFKIVQLLWRTAWRFVTKLNIYFPFAPAISYLGVYPSVQTDPLAETCTPAVMVAFS